MKWMSPENVKQAADCTNENLTNLSAAVQSTFSEVYENLEAIDQKVSGFSYTPEDEMLTIPPGESEGKTNY